MHQELEQLRAKAAADLATRPAKPATKVHAVPSQALLDAIRHRQDREQAELEMRQRKYLADRELALAFPFDQTQAERLKRSVNAKTCGERGVLLAGPAGTGKTAIADHMAKRAGWDGWGRVVRFKAAEIWREAADAYQVKGKRHASEMLDEIKGCRVMIIDDLGREPYRPDRPDARALLFDLLDCALENCVFALVTSNRDFKGLLAHYADDAWASRLSALRYVDFAGMQDYRLKQGATCT